MIVFTNFIKIGRDDSYNRYTHSLKG